MPNDNNDILALQYVNVHFTRGYSISLGANLKRQRGCTKIKLGKRKKAEPFTLPKSPGTLAGFYFSCGPLAAFGFFVGNLEGFVFAIVGDVMFWVLIALLKDINEKCRSNKIDKYDISRNHFFT